MDIKHLQNFNVSLPLKLTNSDGVNTSKMLFPFIETRQRRRSTSSQSTTPLKKDVEDHQQPEARRSMRRLFEDTKDTEITLKSPFKIPVKAAARTLFSPAKNDKGIVTPRIRKLSSNNSPVKNNIKVKTLRKRENANNYSPPAKNENGVITPRIRKFASSNSPTKSDIKVKTPRKREPSAIDSPPLFTPERSNVNDQFDLLVTKDKDIEERLLLTPTTKTYSKAAQETPQSKRVEGEDLNTPDSASRPHRKKKPVEKLGIADVKL